MSMIHHIGRLVLAALAPLAISAPPPAVAASKIMSFTPATRRKAQPLPPEELTGRVVELLDVQSLRPGEPQSAIKRFEVSKNPEVVPCDVLIAGAGLGGVAAALAALRAGVSVCMSEETDWPGGQMTSQGVSALDENHLVETTGSNRSYRQLREMIRNHYRQSYRLDPGAETQRPLNPGDCWVSRLAFEPEIAVEQINSLLKPYIDSGKLRIHYRLKPVDAYVRAGRLIWIDMVHLDTAAWWQFRPRITIDATELGYLLPIAGVPYRTGAESRSSTHEPHALDDADPHPRHVAELLDSLPGAYERATLGLERARAGETIALEDL